MQAIPVLTLCLLLSCAANVHAGNYCDSPRWSIVHNKSYDEVMQIAGKRDKIRDAECSFTDVILRIQNEEAGIGRYPGILLIADAQTNASSPPAASAPTPSSATATTTSTCCSSP